MSKPKPLSPEKYITTKARSLPIAKCYVNVGWKIAKMVNVIVMRRHVNGNYTAGIYLIDLLCLGVKDTFYYFNEPIEIINEQFPLELNNEEAEYNLVHNIVYAGHDFAMDFDIKPHEDFSVTKFILEEDDDNIPLIEIPVGDEDGKPYLMVNPSYNYASALQKLKQYAGEGNYRFLLGNDLEDEFDDNDEFDDDELDEDEDEFDDDDEVYMDFNVVKDMESEELEEMIEEGTENFSDLFIVNTETLLRQLNETEIGVIEHFETIKEKRDFQLFEKKKDQWTKAYDDSKEEVDILFPELQSLSNNYTGLDSEALMAAFIKLLEKHKSKDIISFMIVNSIPLMIMLAQLKKLEKNFAKYTPSVQLFITSYAVLQEEELSADYNFIINASTVEMAYPFNRMIHGLHHKLFWLVKALYALRCDNKDAILHYHNLLRISGTGGHIKYLYAAQLVDWLSKYMGIEVEDEDEDDDNGKDYIDFKSV